MEAKIVKVTDKGQISIPMSMQESLGIGKGDTLLMVQNKTKEKNVLILEKVKEDDFTDLLKLSERSLKKFWSSKEDDVWDKV